MDIKYGATRKFERSLNDMPNGREAQPRGDVCASTILGHRCMLVVRQIPVAQSQSYISHNS